ncbi:helix-turn-helix domain-containing protein [Corallococcus sp. EGB]|uniref:helix-turn-helix domain-containing protein n=1 Tax=Corallococcus sp. EGB TaxID=1521117 RepID=UPI001CC0C0FD|nr:helix-turn-helix domain-containing protein [Corallococcus sp. EGB]
MSRSEDALTKKRQRRKPVPLEELPTGLWTVGDCARYLGKSDDWVYKRSADGTLPMRKHGADNRYVPAEIVAWATRAKGQ